MSDEEGELLSSRESEETVFYISDEGEDGDGDDEDEDEGISGESKCVD